MALTALRSRCENRRSRFGIKQDAQGKLVYNPSWLEETPIVSIDGY